MQAGASILLRELFLSRKDLSLLLCLFFFEPQTKNPITHIACWETVRPFVFYRIYMLLASTVK